MHHVRIALFSASLMAAMLLGACGGPSASTPASAPAMPQDQARGQADKLRPTKEEALQSCDAYMGYQKNDCLDKVLRNYAEVVA